MEINIQPDDLYQLNLMCNGRQENSVLVNRKFGTAQTSQLYTLASIKKDAKASSSTNMVNHVVSNWNQLIEEILNVQRTLGSLTEPMCISRREWNLRPWRIC